MSFDSDQYTRIMEQLKEGKLGDVASQLDQEVRQGRAVSEEKLKQEQESQYAARASRLAETKLQRLGESDVAVIPYTGDESIDLIRGAILTLAETMYASRKAALDTALAHEMDLTIEFGDPELEIPSSIHLQQETEQAHVALELVRELLSEGTNSRVEANR
ncbi:hypothetical protein [Streptomyces sp. NPDC001502]|uniref:hypothetical protein n=1 Tax=Streptomyces sp. NPDC001502 TaxID=3364578 RepID=UPI003695C0D9